MATAEVATTEVNIAYNTDIGSHSQEYYSTTKFAILDWPEQAVEWLDKAGVDNTKHITKIRIYIHPVYQFPPTERAANHPLEEILAYGDMIFHNNPTGPGWCALFHKIANEVTGLKHLEIKWDCAYDCDHYGGGNDVTVVRAIGEIKSLETLEIGGCYAKEWPAYLAEKTGAKIVEEQHLEVTNQHDHEFYMAHFRAHQRNHCDIVL